MKTTNRARGGIAAAASMIVLGAGLLLGPLVTTASADVVVNNTPTGSYTKEDFDSESDWGHAQTWDYWCEDGEDVPASSENQREFTTTVDLETLYIKTATTIFYWTPAPAGTYALPDEFQQSISHAMLCNPGEETTPPVTSSSGSSTTPAESGSTTPAESGSTTPGTTSAAASTTPATDPATTPASTPASSSAVSTPTSSEPSLAVTGSSANPALFVTLGLGLVGAGVVTMVATRRKGSHA